MRTWLFVPGHDAHKVEKALQSAAEVVIIDWEDAVAHERKPDARTLTRSIIMQPARSPRCVVRINHTRSAYFADDLAALADLPLGAVMLPKVDDPAEIHVLARHISLPIIPILESAAGIETARAIAEAHPQVERLSFGPLDFLADLGVQWTADNPAYQYARVRVAIAGRAAGLEGAIDGVYPRLEDNDGLRRDALGARAAGYVGKMLIHPAQLAVVREVFSPTPAECVQAMEIMAAFAAAQARGEAAVRLGGTFIDPPVVRWAERVAAMCKRSV